MDKLEKWLSDEHDDAQKKKSGSKDWQFFDGVKQANYFALKHLQKLRNERSD
jgi:hypothetical protein